MYAFDLFVYHLLTCVFHVSLGMYGRVCFMLVREYIWNILEVCVSAGTSNIFIFKYIPEVCGILELCLSAGSILEYTCIYDRLFVWVSVFVPCIWLIFGVWRLCIICPRLKRVKHALHVIYNTCVPWFDFTSVLRCVFENMWVRFVFAPCVRILWMPATLNAYSLHLHIHFRSICVDVSWGKHALVQH